ncbi:MAG: hypothetical protein H8E17_14405 [Deltaproteobacteria bacterium]|nr:hypothetical protein [Deltaproteobacteria bacterium]
MVLKRNILFMAVCLVLSMSLQVLAGPTYSFVNVSNNNPVNAAIGEAQLSVEILDIGSGQVEFLFRNVGPDPASITDIYFDDSDLGILTLPFGFTDIVSINGVSFSPDAPPPNKVSPGDLPSGGDFTVTSGLSADSDGPQNGVNPGEQLGVTLFGNYASVLGYFDDATLRIGLHVQAMGKDGESESFINNGPVVPAPGALALAGIGMTFVGFLRNRKNAV